MTDKYPGLSSYTDRHGKLRWRYRTKERVVSLPAPDQPGFEEAYQAAVEGRKINKAPVVKMPGAALPGTFGAAFQRLKVSVKWLALDEASKRKNTRLVQEFLKLRVVGDNPLTWHDVPIKHLRRAHVEELLGRYIATPHKAKHLLVAIRKLIYVGLLQDWIEIDPTAAIEWRPAYTGWKAWPREAMQQFEQRWPLGTAARTCYGLALWLGNRRGDVAGLRWDQRVTRHVFIDGIEREFDGFDIIQTKNKGRTGGKRLFVPITPMLSEILDAADKRGETVLITAYGGPFSAKSLTGMMAHWCKLAGLPKGLTLHGLRKSLGVYLAEAEASTRQLMDVLGHDDIDHAELYSREASQVRLAVQGMDRVVRLVARRPLLGEPVGEPSNKPLINNDNGGPGGCLESTQDQLVRERWDRAAFKSVPMFFNVFVPLAALYFTQPTQ
ncbi:tyrosine-type recombinase/integrase [Allomesorhizobium camelthorni]|uniref:Tyrosine-type recombinase/integrase n=1 Tax=Allomesorhizobium camelthorni TaxID=475069 RepID=A0A6G4WJK4_9HYPH|nr:tyrosine-type recombinase/integrase [Mesorhizobium camelthorni]NGO54300.1 tyrosine-type recombinase/integrase [Mesorhizobium camelthorni]